MTPDAEDELNRILSELYQIERESTELTIVIFCVRVMRLTIQKRKKEK